MYYIQISNIHNKYSINMYYKYPIYMYYKYPIYIFVHVIEISNILHVIEISKTYVL